MKPEIELLLWTVEQIAEACGLSQGFVKKEIREGRLVAQKVGRLTRVSRPALDMWITNLPWRSVEGHASRAGAAQSGSESDARLTDPAISESENAVRSQRVSSPAATKNAVSATVQGGSWTGFACGQGLEKSAGDRP